MNGLLNGILLAMLLTVPAAYRQKEATGPNIIILFMDDMGYGDLSCYGALDILTPHLDRMAAQGVRLTNFLSGQAVCSASRAALLTGCYPNRIGITGALFPGSPIGLSSDETTIAEMLKQKKYATGIFGKWHLGDAVPFLPTRHGFDTYLGIPYSNDMWPVDVYALPAGASKKSTYPPLPLIRNESPVDTIDNMEDQAMLTALLTDEAIRFIRENKQKPFFAYIPYPMPHVPINATAAFRGKSRQGVYGDVIQEADHHIGRILSVLKQEGLEENTIVIFTSDNGPWLNYGNHAGSSGGFREGKGTTFEGGQRVPCIVQWKGHLPEGIVSNQLCSAIDLLPTLAFYTGCALPRQKIDGVDLHQLLEGDATTSPRRTFLYYYRRNALEAVRRDNWKLVFPHASRSYAGQAPGVHGAPGPAPENVEMPKALYDLRRDPGETYDVQQSYPEIVAELEQLAATARKELGDDLQEITGKANRQPGRFHR